MEDLNEHLDEKSGSACLGLDLSRKHCLSGVGHTVIGHWIDSNITVGEIVHRWLVQGTSLSLIEVHTFVGRTLDLNSDLMLKDLFRSVTPKEFLSMSKREEVVFEPHLKKKKKKMALGSLANSVQSPFLPGMFKLPSKAGA